MNWQNELTGFQPLAQIRPLPVYTGFEGLPFVGGNNQTVLMAQMMLAQPFNQQMSRLGMTPMGFTGQNAYDILQARKMQELRQSMIQQGFRREREQHVRSIRGMARMFGVPFGAEQRAATRQTLGMLDQFAPMLIEQAPDLFDQLGGPGGSQALMSMRVADAARYQIDPVTGRVGLSRSSMETRLRALNTDDPSSMFRRNALTAGQVGGLYQETQIRGMLGDRLSLNDRTRRVLSGMRNRDELGGIASKLGVTLPEAGQPFSTEALDTLRQDPQVAQKLRQFDASRVRRTLESYSGAISAIRDLFGSEGKPNAPIAELIQGLERMTQGQLHQISPGRVANMVRMTHALSQASGLPLDATLMLQQHTAARAQAMGLNPLLAIQATQGSLAFGAAYRGQGLGGIHGWDRFNADQQMQLDANLRLSAADSRMANALGVVARVGTQAGGFQEGTKAANIMEAIKLRRTTYFDPESRSTRSLNLSTDDLVGVLKGARGANGELLNLSASDIRGLQSQTMMNREYMQDGIIDVTRRAQGEEDLQPFLADRVEERVAAMLRGQGIAGKDADQTARETAGSIARRIRGMEQEDLADPTRRGTALGKILRESLGTKLGEQSDAFYRGQAEALYGYADNAARKVAPSFNGLGNWLAQQDGRVLDASQRITEDMEVEGSIREAMTPFGQGTMLSRFVGGLQDLKSGDDAAIEKMLADTLGGVPSDQLRQSVNTRLAPIAQEEMAIRKLHDRYRNAEGPEREAIRSQLTSRIRVLNERVKHYTAEASELGLETEGSSLDAIKTSMESLTTLSSQRGQILDQTKNMTEAERAAKFAKLWTDDNGDTFRSASGEAWETTNEVLSAVMLDSNLLRRAGPDALAEVNSLQALVTEMKDDAKNVAGNSVEKLLAGDISGNAASRAVVQERVTGRLAKIQERMQALQKLRLGQASSTPEAMAAWLGTDAADVARRTTHLRILGGMTAEDQAAVTGRRKADSRAQALADSLGISVADLFAGKGKLDADEAAELADIRATQTASQSKLDAAAGRLGVSSADVLAAQATRDVLDQRILEMQQIQEMDPAALAAKSRAALGLSGTADPKLSELLGKADTAGRSRIAQSLSAVGRLQAAGRASGLSPQQLGVMSPDELASLLGADRAKQTGADLSLLKSSPELLQALDATKTEATRSSQIYRGLERLIAPGGPTAGAPQELKLTGVVEIREDNRMKFVGGTGTITDVTVA